MAITLQRQLSDGEKQQILTQHGRRDFATGLPIPDDEQVQYDHIQAFADGGPTELNNIAPMSAHTNKAKGTLPLEEYRVKRRLEEFFRTGDRLTLGDLLKFMKKNGDVKEFGQVVEAVEVENDFIELRSPSGTLKHRLYTCPTTKWKYFYATVSVDVIDSDDETDNAIGLQPRYLIQDNVFSTSRSLLASCTESQSTKA